MLPVASGLLAKYLCRKQKSTEVAYAVLPFTCIKLSSPCWTSPRVALRSFLSPHTQAILRETAAPRGYGGFKSGFLVSLLKTERRMYLMLCRHCSCGQRNTEALQCKNTKPLPEAFWRKGWLVCGLNEKTRLILTSFNMTGGKYFASDVPLQYMFQPS